MSDITILRSDTGHSLTTLPDVDAQAILDEAGVAYDYAAGAYNYARVLTLRRLLASSAKLHDYVQNNSRESASQVFKNLMDLLKYWDDQLTGAAHANSPGAARFGRTTVIPSRLKEFPGP